MSEEQAKQAPQATKPVQAQAKSAPVPATKVAPAVDQSKEIAALKAQIAEQEKKHKAEQEQLVNQVLSRVGVTLADVEAAVAAEKSGEDMMVIDIGQQVVSINGVRYTGGMTLPRKIAEVIISAAGNYRNQVLREMSGNRYEVMQLATGGISSRLLGPVPESQII